MKKSLFLFLFLTTISVFAQKNKVEPVEISFKDFLNARDFTVSNNQKEAYFSLQSLDEKQAIIVKTVQKNGKWKEVEMVNFSGEYRDIEPFLSPDNLRLYFASDRPLSKNEKKAKDFDIWYVERKSIKGKWSAPKNIGKPINTKFNEFYPSVSRNNNMYYTSDSLNKTKKDEIFLSKWNGKNYEKPVSVGENINTNGYEFNAFIAPDESFLMYTIYKAPEGIGSGDLFISFKDERDEFQKPIHLKDLVNSDRMDYCPFYDINTQILYFTSKRNEVSAKKVKNLSEFMDNVGKYENGLSRIYKIKIDLKKLKG
ncbi:PD40 domain-containing protein [Aureivirga sp. CE67]|uniref:PD40 domain-containing protein n=1 Tax=Aureivirga sp. CE67 TaxID=1788983 RepID=UPI0018C8F5DB|nr:PD40 domain-containing protein [Aureivirga sp. CE67]